MEGRARIGEAPEAAELEVVFRIFEDGVDGVLPHEPPILAVPGPHAARDAIFVRIAAARRRAAVAGVARRLAAAAALVEAVGRADASFRVGDGARRRAVRVRAAGGRGRARLAARRCGGGRCVAHDWRHDGRGGGRLVVHDDWRRRWPLWSEHRVVRRDRHPHGSCSNYNHNYFQQATAASPRARRARCRPCQGCWSWCCSREAPRGHVSGFRALSGTARSDAKSSR